MILKVYRLLDPVFLWKLIHHRSSTHLNKMQEPSRVGASLQHAANHAKMISSTECALYVHTEQQHWTSHNEVPIFISRPLYILSECQRMLSGSKYTSFVSLCKYDALIFMSFQQMHVTDAIDELPGTEQTLSRKSIDGSHHPATDKQCHR